MIYYVQRESDSLVKIGWTGAWVGLGLNARLYRASLSARTGRALLRTTWNGESRERVIATGPRVPVRLLGQHPGDRALEAEIHRLFAAQAVGGELFTPDSELLSWIRDHDSGGHERERRYHQPYAPRSFSRPSPWA